MWTTLSLRTESGRKDRTYRQERLGLEARRQQPDLPRERARHLAQECPGRQAEVRWQGQGRQPERAGRQARREEREALRRQLRRPEQERQEQQARRPEQELSRGPARQEEPGMHRREPEVQPPDRERLPAGVLPEGQLRGLEQQEGLEQPGTQQPGQRLPMVTAL